MPSTASQRRNPEAPLMLPPSFNTTGENTAYSTPGNKSETSSISAVKECCHSPRPSRLHQQVTQFKLLKRAQNQGTQSQACLYCKCKWLIFLCYERITVRFTHWRRLIGSSSFLFLWDMVSTASLFLIFSYCTCCAFSTFHLRNFFCKIAPKHEQMLEVILPQCELSVFFTAAAAPGRTRSPLRTSLRSLQAVRNSRSLDIDDCQPADQTAYLPSGLDQLFVFVS